MRHVALPPGGLLALYLAAVFAYAAVVRAADAPSRHAEEARFGLPRGAGWAVVALELWLAAALLRGDPAGAPLAAAFLLAATALVLWRHWPAVAASARELSTYQPSALGVVLHATYAAMAIAVAAGARR